MYCILYTCNFRTVLYLLEYRWTNDVTNGGKTCAGALLQQILHIAISKQRKRFIKLEIFHMKFNIDQFINTNFKSAIQAWLELGGKYEALLTHCEQNPRN